MASKIQGAGYHNTILFILYMLTLGRIMDKIWMDDNFLKLSSNRLELIIIDPKALLSSAQVFLLFINDHNVPPSPSVHIIL